MTQTVYMVIARLHNVRHVFIKSQLAINGYSKYANWLWTRHDGVNKLYRSNHPGGIFKRRDLCRVPVTSASFLYGLSSRLLSKCHLATASAQFDKLSMSWSDERSMDVYNCVSYAYWCHNTLNVDIRRLTGVVNTENRSGPRTEPCGTLVLQ